MTDRQEKRTQQALTDGRVPEWVGEVTMAGRLYLLLCGVFAALVVAGVTLSKISPLWLVPLVILDTYAVLAVRDSVARRRLDDPDRMIENALDE